MTNQKKFLTVFFSFLLLGFVNAQNIGINEDGSSPDASAILDIKSNSKGVLFPRVHLTSLGSSGPVSNPKTGLMIYNTNSSLGEGFHYWNGSQWQALLNKTTYNLPNSGGTVQWVKLGSLKISQGGNSAYIKVITNSGYNADINQNNEVFIRFKTSNSNSVDANGFAGDATYRVYGKNNRYKDDGNIKIVANNAGTAATSYDFYMHFNKYTGSGSFYTIETTAGEWTDAGDLGQTDPGTGSATVLIVPKVVPTLDQDISKSNSTTRTTIIGNNTGSYSNGTSSRGWSIGTWQDVSGLSITKTIPAGKKVLVSFNIDGFTNDINYHAPSYIVFRVVREGTPIGLKAGARGKENTYYYNYFNVGGQIYDNVSGGSNYTWKVQYYMSDDYSSTERAFLEDRNLTITTITP